MVLCFGELLLRFLADENGNWIDKKSLDVYLDGAEYNLASALAKWKVPVGYCTVLPQNFMSSAIIKKIALQNINTSAIEYYAHRTGVYYSVGNLVSKDDVFIYDKNHTSFETLKTGFFNWNKILDGIRWFHFGAITPSLNEDLADVCLEVLHVCAKKGITVSVDVNTTANSWQYDKKPADVMTALLQHCDIITLHTPSANNVLPLKSFIDMSANQSKEYCIQQSKKMAQEIVSNFPKCKVIANNFALGEKETEVYATLFTNNIIYASATYTTNKIIDASGSNDAFAAGLIYGIHNHLPYQQVVNFATAAAFQKLFIVGNATDKSAEEVKTFIQNYHS